MYNMCYSYGTPINNVVSTPIIGVVGTPIIGVVVHLLWVWWVHLL